MVQSEVGWNSGKWKRKRKASLMSHPNTLPVTERWLFLGRRAGVEAGPGVPSTGALELLTLRKLGRDLGSKTRLVHFVNSKVESFSNAQINLTNPDQQYCLGRAQ